MDIIRVEPHWSSLQAQEHFEWMQKELARAMAMPEWAMRSPDAMTVARNRLYQQTEVMRRELSRFYIEHCHPVLIAAIDSSCPKDSE